MPGDENTIPEHPYPGQGGGIEKDRGRLVACSPYFVNRWMPLLGGTGTMLVLALRSLGYHNPKTGETRDAVAVNREVLASMCGVSVDTISRELNGDRKRPANEWLARFVQVQKQYQRDRLGRVIQEENCYRIAMGDPVHPDDEAAVNAYHADAKTAAQPEPQSAEPEPQNAAPLISTLVDPSSLSG